MIYGNAWLEAVVDWIELEIQLSERSNFMTVQDHLRDALKLPAGSNPHVEALDETAGRSASNFRFRIQDPKQMRQLDQVLARMRERFDFGSPQILAIEVAFDTYVQGGSVRDLAEVMTDRYRFLTTAPGDDWYFYRNSGEGRLYLNTLDCRRDLVRHFEQQWQMTDRNSKTVPVRYHAYVKTMDGTQALSPETYRARLEVTLQGEALPFTTLEQLKAFDFTKMADHFKFRRLADTLHPMIRHPMMTWMKDQLGRRGQYRRPIRKGDEMKFAKRKVLFRHSTVADDGLNAAAYECLRKLTTAWRSKRAGADFPGHSLAQTRTDTANA
jgi:hypothetical protein